MIENKLLILSAKDVAKSISMIDCIKVMKDAFLQLQNGKADVPLRTGINMPNENTSALFMPAYLPEAKKIGLKTVTINKNNPQKGLPVIQAMVMVFDSETGSPIAVMDGEVLTAMRTGAVSGLATNLLARENSETVAIIGTGAQGETQLEAVCAVRKIKKAFVFDLNKERAKAFSSVMKEKLNIEIIVANKPELIGEADIICTATPSTKPVFSDKYLKPGTHINAVGSYRPEMCEIPAGTIVRAKIILDQKEACLSEAGDLVQPLEKGLISENHIHAELGEVIVGKKSARENESEITFFKSVGVAVQDLAAADLVLKKAKELGLGTEVNI